MEDLAASTSVCPDKQLVKNLQLELKTECAIQPVFIGRHDGDVDAHALVFIADGGDQGREPAAIAHFWITVEAADHGAQAQRTHLYRLVVHTQVVRVRPVAIVEAASSNRGNG